MLEEGIIAVLSLIESILPLVTGTQSAAAVTATDNIINALEKLLPSIVTWSENIYNVVKNIITSLQNSGNLTASQITATQSLETTVDAQWAAVESQIDPDNPANVGTPAGG